MRVSFKPTTNLSHVVFAILSSYLLVAGISQFAVAQTEKEPVCNCVIFRLDDVHDNWRDAAQVDVMNLFLAKDQSLSVAIVMNTTGKDQTILQKIREGQSKGLFELDIHGWNHVDYTKLSEQEQEKTLDLSNIKMQSLFGTRSTVFVPPYGLFNNSTLIAMSHTGMHILSASAGPPNDNRFIWSPSLSFEPYSVYQLPQTIGFMYENHGTWQNISNSVILSSIDNNIAERGYAVVVLHPQNFVKKENGQYVLDEAQINRLSSLIDSVLAKKIHVETFENVIAPNPPPNQMKTIPNLVHERNDMLKQQRAKIHDMIQECHLEMKGATQNHKQIADECKAKIKKLRADYKYTQEQTKSELEQMILQFIDQSHGKTKTHSLVLLKGINKHLSQDKQG